jgi:hypothetical protein
MAGHGHAQQSRDFINELKNEKTNLTLKAGIYKLTSLQSVRLYRLERGQEQQNVTEKHADSQ